MRLTLHNLQRIPETIHLTLVGINQHRYQPLITSGYIAGAQPCQHITEFFPVSLSHSTTSHTLPLIHNTIFLLHFRLTASGVFNFRQSRANAGCAVPVTAVEET